MKAIVEDPDLVRDRQARLAAAGAYLFRRKGYAQTSVPEIARQAGMSVGSVYRYIRKKEDILLLILRAAMERYEVRVRPVFSAPLPPAEKLTRFIEAYLRHIDQERDSVLVMYRNVNALGAKALADLEGSDRAVTQDARSIIEDGMRQGVFRPEDPDLVAHNIVVIAHMWALRRWRFPKTYTVDDYIQGQTRLIICQLAPER